VLSRAHSTPVASREYLAPRPLRRTLTKSSRRRPGSCQRADKQCCRDCRQAVPSGVQDALLQVQQHVESPDAGRSMSCCAWLTRCNKCSSNSRLKAYCSGAGSEATSTRAAMSSADSCSPLRILARFCTVCIYLARAHLDVTNTGAVPVNLKDRDEFHLSLEEYLQSLISLVEELVRHNLNHPHTRRAR
jgi:hypothetical protein